MLNIFLLWHKKTQHLEITKDEVKVNYKKKQENLSKLNVLENV